MTESARALRQVRSWAILSSSPAEVDSGTSQRPYKTSRVLPSILGCFPPLLPSLLHLREGLHHGLPTPLDSPPIPLAVVSPEQNSCTFNPFLASAS